MIHKPIGIFDSGIGGLSVYQEIVKLLPDESTVYIGDSALAPYGKLSEDAIFERSKKLVAFLLKKNVKLIVVACNTITVSCIHKLRETYPETPIIGTVPVVKTAASTTKAKCFGILSTTRTADSAYQKKLIKEFADSHTVLNLGTDELVPLIEKGILEGEQIEAVLRKVLEPYKEANIDTLALGCTHFPFIKKEIQKLLGKDVQVLDSGAAIARHVKHILSERDALINGGDPERKFYTTGDTGVMDIVAKNVSGSTIASERVTV